MTIISLPAPSEPAPTDPFDLEAERLPIFPKGLLSKFDCDIYFDTRYRSNARLQQCLWRLRHGLPIGEHISMYGGARLLGSRISALLGRRGANFLSADVARFAIRCSAFREIGAFLDEERLLTNLLSSGPLVFNLYGPLALSAALANAFVSLLFPDLAGCTVTRLLFESSPGRGHAKYLGDGSAHDLVICYRSRTGKRGFIAVEQKLSEGMNEPAPTEWKPRYQEVTRLSNLFVDPDDSALRANPLQQLTREHLLAYTMVHTQRYDEGRFVLVGPRLNYHVQRAASQYRQHLKSGGTIPFVNISLERVINTLAQAGADKYARQLFERYCDFSYVDEELDRWLFSEDFPPSSQSSFMA